MDTSGNLEDGLESDALLTNVALQILLGALTHATNSLHILFGKSILVGFKDYFVGVQGKGEEGIVHQSFGLSIPIIFGILNKLKHESRIV